MFDLLLRGGTVVDGTGAPGFRADVAIAGDRIAALGALTGASAPREIDAAGCVVAPGFIDAHVHGDLALLADPRHEPAIFQGVTTYVLGQDGCGFAPARPETIQYMREYTAGFTGWFPELRCDWKNFEEYWARFDRRVSVNVAYLVPNGAVRMEVMGLDPRPARDDEIARMQRLVREMMEQGAVGLSTGLDYLPSKYADTGEIAALSKAIAPFDGVYVTHMRDLSRGMTHAAIDEVFEIGRRSGARLHLSHFGARADDQLRRVDSARRLGFDVTFDTYPYLAGMTLLAMIGLPDDVQQGGAAPTLERLSTRKGRERAAQWWRSHPTDPRNVHLAGCTAESFQSLVGLSLAAAADAAGRSVAGLVCDILLESRLAANAVVFDVRRSEADLIACMTHPAQMGGSDGIYWGQCPHPRGHGAFARFLGRYVREKRAWTLEEAVRHFTHHAALRYQLAGRGVVREGAVADLVVFDPAEIADRSTYATPRALAAGVRAVLVGGVVTLEEGRHTGAANGRALRRGEP